MAVLGIAIILLAMLITAFRRPDSERVRGGGIIMVGPFPIIFGTDAKTVKALIVLVIILMVIVLTFMLVSSILV